MDESNKLPIKDSTKKLAMLVTLTTAQRGQSIHLKDIKAVVAEKESIYIYDQYKP